MAHEYYYTLSRTHRTVCPQCGHRTFKPYVDPSGEILSGEAGRCNRENSCGYHMSPREWLTRNGRSMPSHLERPARREAPKGMSVIDPAVVDASMWHHFISKTPLGLWLKSKWGLDAVRKVYETYRIGYAKYGFGSTVWWYIDAEGRARSGKAMVYGLHGKRIRNFWQPTVCWAHTLLKLKEFNYVGCHFGTHLLDSCPDAEILVVESEKSAIILALYLMQNGLWGKYLPIATGGCSGVRVDPQLMSDKTYRWAPFAGRKICLIPDADKTAEWSSENLLKSLRGFASAVRVYDITELHGAKDSEDCADLIMDGHLSPWN